MQLDKYYLDVVTDEGGGCIGYAARLDGFGLGATLAATLSWDSSAAAGAHQRRTLRGQLPAAAATDLMWHCPALAVAGRWTPQDLAGAETVLWSDGRARVVWQVLASRAAVRLQLGAQTISGWGYAERLQLDLPPWRLPIDGLRWGRYVSASDGVVWIEWEHAAPRRWLWHNGTLCPEFQLTGTGVMWPAGRLAFGEQRTIRSGRLADTAFARWPGVQRWLPRRLRLFDEKKWCAPALLTATGRGPSCGWVIHEYVGFR